MRGVSEEGLAINQGNMKYGIRKRRFLSSVLHRVAFDCLPGFSLVLDHRCRPGGKVVRRPSAGRQLGRLAAT